MRAGAIGSAALCASGIAAIVAPERILPALHLTATDARGSAEVRAGLGGTYAALGAYALVSRSPAARRAVGMTWLGAAAARMYALQQDEPEADATFWAYFAGEVVLGLGALRAHQPRRSTS
jgi:hypothetical protein